MTPIDQASLNFSADSLLVLNFSLAFILFGIALDLKLGDFRLVLQQPRQVVVGLASQLVLLPALTFLLVLVFDPIPSLGLGLILVAACPGGMVSNFIAHLAKANAALSVTLTGIMTIGAILFTPLNFSLWAGMVPGYENHLKSISLEPFDMIRTIFLLVGIPLILGMGLAFYFPRIAKKLQKPVKILSILIFASFIVVAVAKNVDLFLAYYDKLLALVCVHNALALLAGYSFAKISGLQTREARTISIETGMQNSGLGLVLIFNFFDGMGGMALVAAAWGVWHLISGMLLALFWSRKLPEESLG